MSIKDLKIQNIKNLTDPKLMNDSIYWISVIANN